MSTPSRCLPALGLAALAAAGCGSTGGSTGQGPAPPVAEEPEPAALVGPTDRAEIEATKPEWVEETVMATPDPGTTEELLTVEAAEITIYLGTWCSDSRRELARFWRALDGLPFAPPLDLRYIAVDRAKREPAELVAGADLRYVPTFVVTRDGSEIGRVIEEAPGGIESDLLELLAGRASGWISARDDLGDGPGPGTE